MYECAIDLTTSFILFCTYLLHGRSGCIVCTLSSTVLSMQAGRCQSREALREAGDFFF